MSNIAHKVKDAITGHHSETKPSSHESTVSADNYGSGTYHDSKKGPIDVGSGPVPKTHSVGHNTYGSGVAGGSTNINAGPHDSKMANKLDPRVDSDLDNRGTHGASTGAAQYGAGSNTYGSSTTGHGSSNIPGSGLDTRGTHGSSTGTGTYGAGSNTYGSGTTGYGSGNINAGPHDSKLANKADPRVVSDFDNRGTHGHGGLTGSHHTGGGAYNTVPSHTASTGATGGYGSTYSTASGITGGTIGGATGGMAYGGDTQGYNTRSTNTGLQDTGLHSNAQQPGFGGNAAGGSSYNQPAGTGNTKTSGPHKSDILNKLDPRVDSSDTKNTHC